MSTVLVELDGQDITANVVFATARFETQVNGISSEAKFRVRDLPGTYSVAVGAEVVLTIDGSVAWRGFLTNWTRTYVFPAINVTEFGPSRFFDATCSDINVLMVKRFVYDQGTPTNILAPLLPAHTADTTAITELFADWIDLSGDGIDTTSLVENVGDTTWTQPGRAWEGSDSWYQAMQSIANLPAAIFYLNPDKKFVYTDVDTPNAPFGLSDQPNGTTTKGYREMEVLQDGTGLANDVMCWGIGYGSSVPVFVRDIDATSVSDHGVWQLGQTSFGVYVQSTIDRIASSIIDGSPDSKRGAKNDRVAVMCTTYEPGLRAADKVPFTSNVFGFSDVIPIRKMAISFDAPTTPKYELTLSHEIDTPFGFFDPFMWNFGPFPPLTGWPPPTGPVFPGPAGCSPAVCGITDSFNRIVADDWGTSDALIPWGMDPSDPSVGLGVNGTVGYASLPSDEGVLANLLRVPGLSDPAGFVIIVQCAVENVPDPTSDPSQGSMGVNLYTDLLYPSVNVNVSKGAGVDGWDGKVRLQEDADLVDVPYNAFGDAVPFFIKWQRIPGDTARVKVWNVSDPEPSSWLAELPASTDIPIDFQFDLESLTSAPAFDPDIISIDSLDISGANRCTAPQFDDFERIASNGWGTTTPSGYPWSITLGASSLFAVNGTGGEFNLTSNTSARIRVLDAGGPWNLSAYTVHSSFILRDAPGNAGFGDKVTSFSMLGGGVQIAPNDGPPITGSPKSFVAASGNVTFIPHGFWVAGGRYSVTIVVFGGQITWSITDNVDTYSATGLFTPSSSFNVGADANGPISTQKITLDYIDIDYAGKPCYPGGPDASASPPINTWVCESFDVATSVLTLSHSFLALSPLVWVNGLLQPPSGYTADPVAGTITLGFTPIATDSARVCYWSL